MYVSVLGACIVVVVAFYIQVVGPFIDTKHLLFGDYAPTVMVSETAGSFLNVLL